MADPTSHADRSTGEKKFIEQRTRQLLVKWADWLVTGQTLKDGILPLDPADPYVHYAATRKSPFISNKGKGMLPGEYKMLAGGWSTAAAFLKR
jgi:hypothetical protein